MFFGRTDLALERRDGLAETPAGVSSREFEENGLHITQIDVLDEIGAKALQKPVGRYLTAATLDTLLAESDWIWRTALSLSKMLRPLLPDRGPVLVVGLGNRAIAPDALGPLTMEQIVVTRHLIEKMPNEFGSMRPVCALTTGVLGITGVETAEIIRGVMRQIKPEAVIAVDALAARALERLCRTFQFSDTGITPGSGACNPRDALDKDALGVPVIAAGVPTVVDALTLCADLIGKEPELPDASMPAAQMLVAPKDVDIRVRKCAKALGYAINLALQGEMTAAEIEQFLS